MFIENLNVYESGFYEINEFLKIYNNHIVFFLFLQHSFFFFKFFLVFFCDLFTVFIIDFDGYYILLELKFKLYSIFPSWFCFGCFFFQNYFPDIGLSNDTAE